MGSGAERIELWLRHRERSEPGGFRERSEPGGFRERSEPGGFRERSEPGGFCERRVGRRVRDDALVADLAVSLGAGPVGLEIDGRPARATDRLDEVGLCQGSSVRALPDPSDGATSESASPAEPCPRPAGAVRGYGAVVVRDGLDAGRRMPLRTGSHLIGSSPVCDLVLVSGDVSALHVAVEVDAAGSIGWSWLGGPAAGTSRQVAAGDRLEVGGIEVCIEGPDPDRRPDGLDPVLDRTPQATLILNRPPRPDIVDHRPALEVPQRPAAVRAAPLAVAGVALPLAVAAVLVVATGNWLFALLTVMSPVLALTGWLSARRAARRDGRGSARRYADELDRFVADLEVARSAAEAALARRAVDLAESMRRVRLPSARLWERRLGHPDAAVVRLGRAVRTWPVASAVTAWPAERDLDPELAAAVAGVAAGRITPVEADLGRDRVLGIVGDRAAATAVARSVLVQLAVHHGPADLELIAVASHDRGRDWAWTQWLPHAADPSPGEPGGGLSTLRRLIAAGREPAGTAGRPFGMAAPGGSAGIGGSPAGAAPRRCPLLLVDDDAALVARDSPVREVLRGAAGPFVAVVVAATADRLPATCRLVVEVDASGTATLSRMADATTVEWIEAMGASVEIATAAAAGLARFDDPELEATEAALPGTVGLLDLLGRTGALAAIPGTLPDVSPSEGTDVMAAALAGHWSGVDPDRGGAGLAVPLGVGADGPVIVDLVADGPHALVAGTTGAGKSELLRSWVAALATVASPSVLNVVLIDFKGGSAFDACADLPHTVSVVSDLDGDLAGRVLRGLQAELRFREAVLRAAGVGDLAALHERARAARATPELARLVVIIDEFATLATEHPQFLDALVGIAQRGRSLGLHLVLATQRPSGVVSEHIRANTNIRIALRVQDRADALDVIDRPDAAALGRHHPGRAYVRLGRHDVTLVQTAYSAAMTPQAHPGPVECLDAGADASRATAGPTDLERLVAAARRAAGMLAIPALRVPWPDPLPPRVTFDDLDPALAVHAADPSAAALSGAGRTGPVPFCLVDEPDRQRRTVGGWDPAAGNLLVFGSPGSGATGTLVTLGVSLAGRFDPRRLHLHLLADDAALLRLAELDHVGTVVRRSDLERRTRLLWRLTAELERRREAGPAAGDPMIVVMIDGLGGLMNELSAASPAGDDADRLSRLLGEGPAFGLFVAATVEHGSAVRHGVLASVSQRLVLRLADPLDARQLGVDPVTGPPGRGRLVGSGATVQVVDPEAALAGVAGLSARRPSPPAGTRAWSITPLPTTLASDGLPAAAAGLGEHGERRCGPDVSGGGLCAVVFGLGGPLPAPAGWVLRPGEAALVAGPVRSGRSSVLATVASRLVASSPGSAVVAHVVRRSPLSSVAGVVQLMGDELDPAALIGFGPAHGCGPDASAPPVLLVDDAEQVADPAGVVAAALAAGWVVVGAGRADALRGLYGHWSRALRSGRTGLLLRPDLDVDGELLGVRLPRRAEAPLGHAGRGYLVQDGAVSLFQSALPPPRPANSL